MRRFIAFLFVLLVGTAGCAGATGAERPGDTTSPASESVEADAPDRDGSIEPGKVANLVVWSGDPFELDSRPVHVMIRGEVVPPESRQRDLLDRYRVLEPGVPPAFR